METNYTQHFYFGVLTLTPLIFFNPLYLQRYTSTLSFFSPSNLSLFFRYGLIHLIGAIQPDLDRATSITKWPKVKRTWYYLNIVLIVFFYSHHLYKVSIMFTSWTTILESAPSILFFTNIIYHVLLLPILPKSFNHHRNSYSHSLPLWGIIHTGTLITNLQHTSNTLLNELFTDYHFLSLGVLTHLFLDHLGSTHTSLFSSKPRLRKYSSAFKSFLRIILIVGGYTLAITRLPKK